MVTLLPLGTSLVAFVFVGLDVRAGASVYISTYLI